MSMSATFYTLYFAKRYFRHEKAAKESIYYGAHKIVMPRNGATAASSAMPRDKMP